MPSFRYLKPEQIEELESEYMKREGIDGREMVRRVGTALASELYFFPYEMYRGPKAENKKVCVVCGWGVNGADGWETAAALVRQYGIKASVISLVSPDELEGLAWEVAQDAITQGVNWIEVPLGDESRMLEGLLAEADIVVDAIFGRNFHEPLGPDFARVCETINRSNRIVVSIDVASGVSVHTGIVNPYAVKAAFTFLLFAVHHAYLKKEPFLSTVMFKVEDFGTHELQNWLFDDAPKMYTEDSLAPFLPFPDHDDNKYTRGRVLIVAGSKEYTGAAVLSSLAATNAGAGYVRLVCPASIVSTMQAHLVTVPVAGLAETNEGTLSLDAFAEIEELARRADTLLIGPGLGRNADTAALVRKLVSELSLPIVLDADALNAFIGHTDELAASRALLTLTPHEGELARLIDVTSEAVRGRPLESARKLAGENRVVLLKGPTSYIVGRDECAADVFAPPMLATAGTGDVLAGMISAFIAQRVSPYMASLLGVNLLGTAAKAALRKRGPISVTALSVLERLPDAVSVLLTGRWMPHDE